jgi:hypothetical protein
MTPALFIGGRRSDHRQSFLDRAQPRLRQMFGRAPAAEPGVVRWIEQEVGAIVAVRDMARKDNLVANLHADFAKARQRDALRTRPRIEINVAGHEP